MERVYEWESRFKDWNHSTLKLAACRALLRQACKTFGLEPPRLKTQNGGTSHYVYERNDGKPDIIILSRKLGLNRASVLHEAAHYITNINAPRAQSHGPSFMSCYLALLELAEVAPRAALRASAREAGLKWRRRN